MCASTLLLFSYQPHLSQNKQRKSNNITGERSYAVFTISEGILVLTIAGKRRWWKRGHLC